MKYTLQLAVLNILVANESLSQTFSKYIVLYLLYFYMFVIVWVMQVMMQILILELQLKCVEWGSSQRRFRQKELEVKNALEV